MDSEAYSVSCPKCGAEVGKPCTYITHPQKGYTWTETPTLRPGRFGDPTRRPHNERVGKWRRIQNARETVERRAKLRVDPLAYERRAYADALADEQRQLKAWLARYGSVLWTSGD